jgi:hypothetical protein
METTTKKKELSEEAREERKRKRIITGFQSRVRNKLHSNGLFFTECELRAVEDTPNIKFVKDIKRDDAIQVYKEEIEKYKV